MGFGREIRDFIAAAQAGYKLAGSASDEEYKTLRNKMLKSKMSPTRLQAEEDLLKARAERARRGPQARPMHPAAVRALDEKTNYYRTRNELLKNPPAPPRVPSAVDDAVPVPPPATGRSLGPQSALDVDDEYDTAEVDPDMIEENEPFMTGAQGGHVRPIHKMKKVKHFADGGAVEDEDDLADAGAVEDYTDDVENADPDDDGDDNTGGAIDVDAEEDELPAAAAPTSGQAPAGYSPQAAHDAALAGVKHAKQATAGPVKNGAVEVSAQSRQPNARAAYIQRKGAATQNEMDEVRKAIDPENKLSPSQRNMAALAHVYEYNLRQNNPQGAARAAASMMQYFGQVSGRYQALAKVAAESGDVDGAVKAMMKAHQNIPDGQDLRVFKRGDGSIGYSFIDEKSGNVIEEGLASPNQLLEFATKGAQRSMEDFIAQASGVRAGNKPVATPKAERAPKGDGGVPLNNAKAAQESISTAWDEITAELKTGDKPVQIDPGVARNARTDAFHIMMHPENRKANLTPADAVLVTGALAIPNPENPDSKPFKIETVEGGRQVALANGRKAFVPEEQFNQLIAARGRAQQKTAKPYVASDPGDETGATGTKPGFWQGAGQAINRGLAATPQGPAGVPDTRPQDRTPKAPLPVLRPWKSIPLDDVPLEHLGGVRGKGER